MAASFLLLAASASPAPAAPTPAAPPPAAPAPSPRARYPEALAACSHHLAAPVIEVWLYKCDRPSPGPGVELWAQGASHRTALGTATPERIDELRAAGCPLAVLCTSANEYASLVAGLSQSAKAKRFARARRLAKPVATKKDGVFLGLMPIRD